MAHFRRPALRHVLTPLEAVVLSTDFAGNCLSRQPARPGTDPDERQTAAVIRRPRAA